jgi:putative membrane protein
MRRGAVRRAQRAVSNESGRLLAAVCEAGVRGVRSLPLLQRCMFAVVLVGIPISAWGAVYPPNTWLQVGPVVIIVAMAWQVLRLKPLSDMSVGWFATFLLLHLFAARWTYSGVPYDQWLSAITGHSVDAAFGFKRNMFDRLVHFAFGLCAVVPLVEIGKRYLCYSFGSAVGFALLFVLAASAVYEIFEWLVAVTMDPLSAEAYNGQQGDIFDPQKDMLAATLGSVVAFVTMRPRWRQM